MNYNTTFGFPAGDALTTGTNNTFIGVSAGMTTTLKHPNAPKVLYFGRYKVTFFKNYKTYEIYDQYYGETRLAYSAQEVNEFTKYDRKIKLK